MASTRHVLVKSVAFFFNSIAVRYLNVECDELDCKIPGTKCELFIFMTCLAFIWFLSNKCHTKMDRPKRLYIFRTVHRAIYEGNSISKLQIQVATYVFELSAGNCHR